MTSSLSAIDEINSLISVIKQWRYDHSSLVYNGSFFEPSPSQITSIHDQNGVFLVSQLNKLLDDLYIKFKESKLIDPMVLFKPLIDIIQSESMSAFVKGSTIGTIHRLLNMDVIDNSNNENISNTISMIIESIVSCKFEQTDSGDDEIAVMWILETILSCFKKEIASEFKTWEMFDVVFGVCTDIHHADMLRCLAFRAVSTIVKTIFSNTFIKNNKHSDLTTDGKDHRYEINRNIGLKIFQFLCIHAEPENIEAASTPLNLDSRRVSFELLNVIFETCIVSTSTKNDIDFLLLHDIDFFHIIQDDLFRILVQTCQTVGRRTTAASTSASLSPLSNEKAIALPFVSGSTNSGNSSSLLRTRKNSFVRLKLEQFSSGNQNNSINTTKKPLSSNFKKRVPNNYRTPLIILSAALRLVRVLFGFGCARQKFKVQMETFFNSVFLRILEGKCSHPEEAEIVLETLCNLLSNPSLVIDLYVGYDCDPNSSDVLQNIMKGLSRLAFPYRLRSPSLESQKNISLKCMIYCTNFISERCDTSIDAFGLIHHNATPFDATISLPTSKDTNLTTSSHSNQYLTPTELLKRKEYKNKLLHCIELFNKSPKKGAAAFADIGVISTADWITKKKSLDTKKTSQNGPKTTPPTTTPTPPPPTTTPTPPPQSEIIQEKQETLINDNENVINSSPDPISSSQQVEEKDEADISPLEKSNATPVSFNPSEDIKISDKIDEASEKKEFNDNNDAEMKDAEILAQLFRTCSEFDREAIGQFLGENYIFNNLVLRSFVRTFDLHGRTLVEALRMFLESFRLPKEAQQIDRVLQAFADVAHEESIDSHLFATVDCTYIFSFAIIMLNTDLHNPNIKPEKKMSLDSFIRNNTNYGMDASKGKDLPKEYLEIVYNEIKLCEINTMVEGGQLTFEVSIDRWRDLMYRVNKYQDASKLVIHDTMLLTKPEISASDDSLDDNRDHRVYAGAYDKMMFLLFWKLVLASVSVIFDLSNPTPPQQQQQHQQQQQSKYHLQQQNETFSMSLDGYYMLAKIAAYFEMNDAFDSILVSICKSTTLIVYGTNANSSKNQTKPGNATKPAQQRMKRENQFVNLGGPSAMGIRSSNIHPGVLSQSGSGPIPLHFCENYKAQEATFCVLSLAKKFGDHIRRSWRHVLYCILRLCDLKLLPNELVLESTDDLTNIVARIRFHRQIARACVGTFEINRARKLSEDAPTSGPGSWLPGWLFGGDAQINTPLDEEQISVLSALRVSESSLLHFLSQTEQKTFASESVITGSNQSQEIEKKLSGKGDPISSISHNHHQIISPQLLQKTRDYIASCHLGEIIQDSKHLSDESLTYFVKALVLTSGGSFQNQNMDDNKSNQGDDQSESSSVNAAENQSEGENTLAGTSVEKNHHTDDLDVLRLAPPTSASRVFCFHLLTEVMLRNRDRIQKLWPIIRGHYFGLIEASTTPSFEIEKVCVGILRICSRCLYREDMAQNCMDSIRRLLQSSQTVAPGLGNLIGSLIVDIVRSGKAFISNESLDPVTGWNDYLSLIKECANRQDSIEYGFEALRITVLGPCTKANVPISDISPPIKSYLEAEWPQDTTKEKLLSILDLFFSLHVRLEPEFREYLQNQNKSSSNENETQDQKQPFNRIREWLFLLKDFVQQAQNANGPHRSYTRDHAIRLFQRAILDIHGGALSNENWEEVFESIIFPLANFSLSLDDEESGQTMTLTMETTTKTILAYGASTLVQLPNNKFESIWIQVLNILGQYHSKDRKFGPISVVPLSVRGISEIVLEHLKNLLLVLAQSDVLIPPPKILSTETESSISTSSNSENNSEQTSSSSKMEIDNKSTPESRRLWEVTWATIDTFSPGMKNELFEQQQ